MAYFANGSEGDDYEATYCAKCVHQPDYEVHPPKCCAVLDAHLLYNYDECNNKNSILHILIPRKSDGFNDVCKMFWPFWLEKDCRECVHHSPDCPYLEKHVKTPRGCSLWKGKSKV